MNFSHFRRTLLWRLGLIVITIFLLAFLALKADYWVSCFGLSLLLALELWLLVSFVEKSHRELNDFFVGLAYGDSRRIVSVPGASTELGEAIERLQARFLALRQTNEELVRYYSLLLEKVPTALVVLRADQSLEMINLAAHKLFQRAGSIASQSLKDYGADFAQAVRDIMPGEKRTSTLLLKQNSVTVVLTAALLNMGDAEQKVLTIHPIQQELDTREIQAWQNLVQVFTHEIMNSMTPVASLSQTASALLRELEESLSHLNTHEKLSDASQAINTLARRADHLMKFVQAYQRIANPPKLQKSPVQIASLLAEVCRLFETAAQQQAVVLRWQVTPTKLSFTLDPVQVEQALINLIKNALEALVGCTEGEIILSAYLGQDGHLLIDVSDNGNGVDPHKREQIFVPFYTSKTEGSGIGLFLVKQVMQAHAGSVSALANEAGGALFRLKFL